jgi:hypothetical protein
MCDNQTPQKAFNDVNETLGLIEKRLTAVLDSHHRELCALLKEWLGAINNLVITLNETLRQTR